MKINSIKMSVIRNIGAGICLGIFAALLPLAAEDGIGVSLPGLVCEAQAAEPTYSAYWFQDTSGNWKIRDGSGKVITNAWVCDDAIPANGKDIWYLLDANGLMVSAGLVQDGTGNYYSLEMNHNGYFGMLRYKSGVYDGINLTLDSSHNGGFARILNQDGLAAMIAKYGVTKVNIDNSNIVYTSSFGGGSSGKTPVVKSSSSSGGHSGGGSSSSSHSGGSSGGSSGNSSSSGGSGSGGSSSGGSSSGGSSSGGSSGGSSSGGSSSSSSSGEDDGEDHSVSYGDNSFLNGNINLMTQEERDQVAAAIEDFKVTYNIDGMSDLDKELMIIWWLASNCLYTGGEPSTATAYGCIINHQAKCAGYADAFLQVAKACGLDARYVFYSNIHAWNLVQLDGEWYHVDVTLEDAARKPWQNWRALDNWFINLTDDEIRVRDGNHSDWYPKEIQADGKTYCGTVVEYYKLTGQLDTQIRGDEWRRFIAKGDYDDYGFYASELTGYDYRFDDGSNYFEGDGIEDALVQYIDKWFGDENNYRYAYLVFPAGTDVSWLDKEWIDNNIGGGFSSSIYISDVNTEDASILVKGISRYEGSPAYVSIAEQKEIYEKALQEAEGVLTTAEDGKILAERKIEERAARYVVIYEGKEELYPESEIYNWNANTIDEIKSTRRQVVVDRKPYLIVEYELTYWQR